MGRTNSGFLGKRPVPQRLVSAKRDSAVYLRVLDPQVPVKGHRDGRCFRSGIRQAPHGTGTGTSHFYRDPACGNPSPGKDTDRSWAGLPGQAVDCSAAGSEKPCLIFQEAQRSIWHAGLRICARAIPAWLRSSN